MRVSRVEWGGMKVSRVEWGGMKVSRVEWGDEGIHAKPKYPTSVALNSAQTYCSLDKFTIIEQDIQYTVMLSLYVISQTTHTV